MNAALEFHDSTISRITFEDGVLSVVFSPAYIHQSEGTPGIDPGNGYTQPVILIFTGATVDGPINLAGTISDGFIELNGVSNNLTPVPLEMSGQVSATIEFQSGSKLSISAQSISCKPKGAAKWIESFPGA